MCMLAGLEPGRPLRTSLQTQIHSYGPAVFGSPCRNQIRSPIPTPPPYGTHELSDQARAVLHPCPVPPEAPAVPHGIDEQDEAGALACSVVLSKTYPHPSHLPHTPLTPVHMGRIS